MDRRTDPAFLRGMTVSRRDALKLAAVALSLSACGIAGKKVAAPKQNAVADYWTGKKQTGSLRFANWPLYIDKDGKHYPSLELFKKETGISVSYTEAIQENGTWFGKIQPQLAAGADIGCDLMVMTNGLQLGKMIELGYLVPLDHTQLPNFAANAAPSVKNPTFDPKNTFTIPWTIGLTGIAYNPKYVDEVTSMADLWNPKYKGKVGMIADSQEIANFGMFALGIDPDTSVEADWRRAGAKLQEQRDAGLVRKYYENDYIEALVRGDIWITMAWSGDVFQQIAEGKDLKFVVPKEGATIWTDNMCIPTTAQNPVDALKLMNFVYQPKVAQMLAEYINYVTPVPAAKALIEAHAADSKGDDKKFLEQMINSGLIFPSDEDMAKMRSYKKLTSAEEKVFESIFQPISQG